MMSTVWSFLTSGLSEFSSFEVTVLLLNVLLLTFAKPLFRVLSHGDLESNIVKARLHIYRVINGLIILNSRATPLRHEFDSILPVR